MSSPIGRSVPPSPAQPERPSTRWHRVRTSIKGDDEYSLAPAPKPKHGPVDLDPDQEPLKPEEPKPFWVGAFRWIFR